MVKGKIVKITAKIVSCFLFVIGGMGTAAFFSNTNASEICGYNYCQTSVNACRDSTEPTNCYFNGQLKWEGDICNETQACDC